MQLTSIWEFYPNKSCQVAFWIWIFLWSSGCDTSISIAQEETLIRLKYLPCRRLNFSNNWLVPLEKLQLNTCWKRVPLYYLFMVCRQTDSDSKTKHCTTLIYLNWTAVNHIPMHNGFSSGSDRRAVKSVGLKAWGRWFESRPILVLKAC